LRHVVSSVFEVRAAPSARNRSSAAAFRSPSSCAAPGQPCQLHEQTERIAISPKMKRGGRRRGRGDGQRRLRLRAIKMVLARDGTGCLRTSTLPPSRFLLINTLSNADYDSMSIKSSNRMSYVRVGESGLKVSKVILGTMSCVQLVHLSPIALPGLAGLT
jgi:hypothetical protein